MNVESVGGAMPRLQPLSPRSVEAQPEARPGASGFVTMLQGMIDENHQANAAADAAVTDLAVGKAQDLHTVTLALAKADMSFRLLLEMRNRLSDAFQEITRMQV